MPGRAWETQSANEVLAAACAPTFWRMGATDAAFVAPAGDSYHEDAMRIVTHEIPELPVCPIFHVGKELQQAW